MAIHTELADGTPVVLFAPIPGIRGAAAYFPGKKLNTVPNSQLNASGILLRDTFGSDSWTNFYDDTILGQVGYVGEIPELLDRLVPKPVPVIPAASVASEWETPPTQGIKVEDMRSAELKAALGVPPALAHLPLEEIELSKRTVAHASSMEIPKDVTGAPLVALGLEYKNMTTTQKVAGLAVLGALLWFVLKVGR